MRRNRWLERLLLAGFDPSEVEDITSDLRDLAATRGSMLRGLYYWTQLAQYPLRRLFDVFRYRRRDLKNQRKREGRMGSFAKDSRYALRALARNPGFTVMAIAIMTVSMGAATAIFSVVDGVLLKPLPFEEPDRLVSLWLENAEGQRARMTPGFYTDIQLDAGVFDHVAAFGSQSTSLSVGDDVVFLRGSRVTSAYFETLGVRPIVGRTFRADEGERGGPAVVILSHHIWEQMFASDPAIVRRSITLDGAVFQVVGVVPPGVYPTEPTLSAEIPFTTSNQDFFVPLRMSPEGWLNHRSHIFGMIGRLSEAVTPEVAEERMAALSVAVQEAQPLVRDEHVLLTPFEEEVVGDVRFALMTVLGMVALVLLIAIVNVGALFVLRAEGRQTELAVRSALGAPRRRLLRQMVLESVLIAAASSLGALLLARLALGVMRELVPYQIPRLAGVTVHGAALVATMGVGLFVALAFGLMPAMRLRGRHLSGPVTAVRQTAGARQRRLQGFVVAVQAGLAVVVLVGAVLLSRSYSELRSVEMGFDAEDAWVMSVPASLESLEEIVRGVRELPGVASAALAYDHPLERNWGDGFVIQDVVRADSDPPTGASLRPFGDGYFAVAGIEVTEGRVPDLVDFGGDVAYAVVNETFSRTFFPDASPVGARLMVPTAQRIMGTDGLFEILGVVADVRFLGPGQPTTPALYVPLSHFRTNASTLIVRAERPDVAVLSAVRGVVAGIDASVGVQQAQRLGDVLDDLLARPRFNMLLLLSFGAIGLVLCGLGAYGLVGRVVAMRVREIGIRMALGADRHRLARSVIRSALQPMILGGAAGLLVAFALGRVIQSLLFGITPADPVSFVASAVFVLAIGVVAAMIPTRRAVAIDPAVVLRTE